MGRLTLVKDRVSQVKGRQLGKASTNPDSWRAGKTTAQRGYGGKWQKARAAYLEKHPLCVECEKEGRYVVATDLDHIIPHRGDMEKFWQRSNWQGLCGACHRAKTAREGS